MMRQQCNAATQPLTTTNIWLPEEDGAQYDNDDDDDQDDDHVHDFHGDDHDNGFDDVEEEEGRMMMKMCMILMMVTKLKSRMDWFLTQFMTIKMI